jgi:hypothetical protein
MSANTEEASKFEKHYNGRQIKEKIFEKVKRKPPMSPDRRNAYPISPKV